MNNEYKALIIIWLFLAVLIYAVTQYTNTRDKMLNDIEELKNQINNKEGVCCCGERK